MHYETFFDKNETYICITVSISITFYQLFCKVCDNGMYGEDCSKTCGSCINNIQCHHVNGSCLQGCGPGYKGDRCVEGELTMGVAVKRVICFVLQDEGHNCFSTYK